MQIKYLIAGFVLILPAWGFYALRNSALNFQIAKSLIGDPLPDDVMYPPSPPEMPPCVPAALPDLLAEYEGILIKLGVPVERCLNKGLSDKQVEEIETQFSIKLSEDIKDLYKWHNGTPADCPIEVFPLGRLLPLDYSLGIKHLPVASKRDPQVEKFLNEWIAFQKSWIEVTTDGFGNGFYFDPDRIDQTSSFFFHAHDDIPYDFYPCIGNWIQSLIDEYERGDLVYENDSVRSKASPSYDAYVERINKYGRHVR